MKTQSHFQVPRMFFLTKFDAALIIENLIDIGLIQGGRRAMYNSAGQLVEHLQSFHDARHMIAHFVSNGRVKIRSPSGKSLYPSVQWLPRRARERLVVRAHRLPLPAVHKTVGNRENAMGKT